MAYEPLHHKYRPQTFADLVGQTAIAATLSNAIAQERIAPAYLFTGPRGTGKTSSARILAKSLNCIAGDRPTASPCGECETCRSITNGSALDVIEIDAASNTGVDNIREIIERAQFAPVQCRFKVYVIDECLTGDSQILTRNGLMSIDNPQIKGQEALSYNENLQRWEYKKVLRWLDRGEKQILIIKTKNSTIRCTGNHLIRTEQGWTKAKEITQGMKILSPVNVDAVQPSKNTALTVKSGGLSVAINYEGINTDRKNTISQPFSKRQKPQVPYVYADVVKNSIFQYFCGVKEEELKASNPIGKDIPTKKAMDFGISELKKLQQVQNPWGQKSLVLSTEHYLGTEVSIILTKTADFPACDGLMAVSSPNGWNTKPNNCNVYPLKYASQQTRVMGKVPFAVKPVAIQTSSKFLTQSNRAVRESKFLGNGSQVLPQKAWPGGIWMTTPFPSLSLEAHQFNYTPKDSPQKKTKLLPSGSVTWDIRPVPNLTEEVLTEKPITTQKWEQLPPENGCQIYESIQSPQWNTNFEEVESITKGIVEKVYDLEVEDNHNFVANGLLVHNCHMLSTAAFNALLKTLEEPPERVIFVLATTDPQRVLPTIISRCQRFDYRRIALDGMVAHLRYIADRESINIDQSALTLVAQISNGGLRDAESLLDQLSLLPDLITPDKVWDLVGAVPEQDLLMLLTAIASNDSETLLGTCRQILDRGREPLVVLQNLAAFYLNLLIAQTAPQRSDLVAVTTETWQELCRIAPQWQTGVILQGQQKLKESEFQIRNTTQPRLWLEVTLLGLLPSACVTLVPVNSGNPSGVNPSIAPPPKPSNLLTFPGSNHLTVVDNPIPQREVESDQKINQVSSEQNFVEEIIEENIANFVPSNINLEQTWTEALNNLGALSQSLFKTYGSLLNLGPGSATVSVTTQQLLNIAAGKKGELETALGQACGHAVKVNLVVGKQSLTGKVESPIPTSPAIHSRPPAIPSESIPDRQTDQSNQINRPLAPNPIDQVQQVPPTESTKQAPPARAQSSPQTIAHSAANSEIKPSPRRETSTGSRPKPQVKPSSRPEENLLEEIPEGETRKAIEQFAKNFSGQIVASEVEPQDSDPDLDQEKELVNPRKSSPPEETSHPIILNRPAIELEDEDDLPF